MRKRGIIVCLVLAVFSLLTLPSISAVESNSVLNLKKSFSYKTPELIKEQISDKLFSKLNNSILFILLSLLLDVIAYRLITQNYTEIAILILLTNLFLVIRFIYKNVLKPVNPIMECQDNLEKLFIQLKI